MSAPEASTTLGAFMSAGAVAMAMPLVPDITLRASSVTAEISGGGMVEVYRATASSVTRSVAIKVL